MALSTHNHKLRKSLVTLGSLSLVLTSLFVILASGVASTGNFHSAITHFDLMFTHVELSNVVANILFFFTYLANPQTAIILEIVLLIIFILIKRRVLAAFFIGGLLGGELLSVLFKMLLARERPTLFLYDISRHGFSFPSGHSIIAIVFYGFAGYCLIQLTHKYWHKVLITVTTSFIIIMVGLSRVLLKFHWASDVIGGWLLGGAVLSILIMSFIHVHAHVAWKPLKISHSLKLILIIMAAACIGFLLFDFYVTHPFENRSTIEYQLRA